MVLTTAPVKVKITKDDETSELRRLAFGYDDSLMVSSGGLFGQQMQGYHLSLCKFVLRSLGNLYPELPVGSFSELSVFTVKDEDGDMVRFDSEEEFVAAMSYKSWEGCLRVEVTVLKSSPSPPPAAAAAATATATAAPEAAPIADTTGSVDDVGNEEPAVSGSVDSEPTPVSETASVMSFVSNLSGSSSSSTASSNSSSPSVASGAPSTAVSARSLATPVPGPTPLDKIDAGSDEAIMVAAIAASLAEVARSSTSTTDNSNGDDTTNTDNNNNNNNNNDDDPPVGHSSPSAPLSGLGDPSTPARAFLTQVLPGLADVLARSMYAVQRGPNGVPNTDSAAPSAAREAGDPLGPAAEGIPAASDASPTAGRATTMAQSVPSTVQAGGGSAAVAAGAPPPSAPEDLRADHPPPAAATADTSEIPPVVHNGVQCDVCDVCPIIGTRYKCAVRADFDICEECESAPAGQDSPFPFLKIRTPAQAPAAIVCLLKPDQPGSAQEAAAARAGDTRGSNNSNGGGPRTFAPGQGWRGRSNPQHGGWGEGRRKGPRWMRDLARRQQYQFERAASGMGAVPPGVEFVRGNTYGKGGGGGGCNRPPWCGPRMQRRRDDPSPVPAADGVNKGDQGPAAATAAVAQEDPTPPASVADSDADKVVVAGNATAAASSVEEPTEKATATAASFLTDPALEQPSPPGEYHDMLAASMRSLASSMTASFPAPASSAQEGGAGKPSRNNGDAGGNKPATKPMARFVTDVSVSDGSPLPPNTRFVKTWCMRNDGPVTFPSGCKIVPVGGDLMAGPEDGVAVEQRAPGEEFHVSVTLTTPPLSGRYIGYWRLQTAEGQKFGHRVWSDVLVTGGTADLVDEGTVDGDWDLVNMQRLSKAVEDTGKDESAVTASTPAAPENIPASVETPPTATVTAAAATPKARSYAPGQAWNPTSAKADEPTKTAADAHVDGGSEESKSSDEGGDNMPEASMPEKTRVVVLSVPSVPPAMATKWHRELCSLAEMGFENTPRNVKLLEKHVVNSGSPGMERVLHELLSWREASIQ